MDSAKLGELMAPYIIGIIGLMIGRIIYKNLQRKKLKEKKND